MYHDIVVVENKDALIETLSNIAGFDCDFIGENGEEFLWNKAKGYDSNLDYVIDQVKDYDDLEEIVNQFFEMWISRDNYYKEYSLRFSCIDEFFIFSYSIIENED